VKRETQNLKEERVIFADSTLFDVFTLPLVAGNPKSALARPNTLVLSESAAKRHFGNADPLGKTLTFDNQHRYEVSGVMKDMPANGHFRYDFFLSMSSLEESKEDFWVSNNFNTYLLLRPGADPEQLSARFRDVIRKYVGPQVKALMNINSIEEFEKSGNYLRYSLMPMTDIHLHSDLTAEMGPNGSILYVYIFAAVAGFILLIACVNFMNLATARSAGRAKEVGVRKVLGSGRSLLVTQFLTEATLMSLLAFVLAGIFAALLLPLFNGLSGKEITPSDVSYWLLPALLAGALVVGLLAGSYPAFFLSAFQPVQVLKGKVQTGRRGGWLRNALVVFQFATSIVLIIGTVVVYRQLDYIQTKKLGFNKEQVLVVNEVYALGNGLRAFKEELLKQPGVSSGTITGYLPVPSWRSDNPFFPEGVIEQDKALSMQQWLVDYDYLATMGMEMVQGRGFDPKFTTDSSAIVINETAARILGYPNPVGRRLAKIVDMGKGTQRSYTIIGVVKNFHFESLRQHVGALSLVLGHSPGNVSFRLKGANVPALVAAAEARWKQMAPGQPFSYSFLDARFDEMYRAEQRIGSISVAFAVLAITIACLGLFGLAAFMAEQRTKEIGIRKVLGASVPGIVALLSKDFLKLVVISFVFAAPLAWWAMHQWLQSFAFQVGVPWWIFALAAAGALLIALLTVSFQSIKAALTNPVESLRSE
jgi:putative ABC transport system permease protein